MKSFKRYLSENVDLPSSKGLDLDRKEMPQIDGKDMKEFMSFLKANGISTEQESINPEKLKPTQDQFHKAKIQSIIDSIEDGTYKPKNIIVSKDNRVVDGHHTWLAHKNLGIDVPATTINLDVKSALDIMHDFPKSYTKNLYESETCKIITKQHMKEFEKFVDKMFEKFGIDFNFTTHFRERMADSRNSPCVDIKELAAVIKKIYNRQGKSIKGVAGAEAVVKDIQSNLNIPVAVKYDSKNDEFDVIMKTIMRKKDFKTPNTIIKY